MLGVSRWLVPVMLSACLWGCAVTGPSSVPADPAADVPADKLPAGESWWYARFHIDRLDDEPPRWYIGTLLAGEVVAPVFDRHYRDIQIWRVHRRASQDEYGHVFSFIC